MWRIHTVLETNNNPRYNSHFNGYGLGWVLTDVVGKFEVSHTGANTLLSSTAYYWSSNEYDGGSAYTFFFLNGYANYNEGKPNIKSVRGVRAF